MASIIWSKSVSIRSKSKRQSKSKKA